ncbi:MAG: hypothetical protein FRX49_09091 [Trebouxia sp. A1-2]|nr:MAG: hypothetical protein FRX49_09091 [Trebouxia sp. A1-2]
MLTRPTPTAPLLAAAAFLTAWMEGAMSFTLKAPSKGTTTKCFLSCPLRLEPAEASQSNQFCGSSWDLRNVYIWLAVCLQRLEVPLDCLEMVTAKAQQVNNLFPVSGCNPNPELVDIKQLSRPNSELSAQWFQLHMSIAEDKTPESFAAFVDHELREIGVTTTGSGTDLDDSQTKWLLQSNIGEDTMSSEAEAIDV